MTLHYAGYKRNEISSMLSLSYRQILIQALPPSSPPLSSPPSTDQSVSSSPNRQLATSRHHHTMLPTGTQPGAAASTISSLVKPDAAGAGQTKCLECDGYQCCCIPIPCTVM
ncbi:hypothetical protein K3495_g1054 [Podosphaera aphanis]|nr:hypothetical protein K3495_g1054 [Podosphaera aphanis]